MFASTSCYHLSETKTEKGYVVEKQYAPSQDGSGTTVTFNSNGGTGIGSTDIHIDEKYMLVFKCEHQVVFSINNSDLYYRLDKGDSVIIEFKEKLNSKNEIKDLLFLDAYKQK